jgi:hypothetical protein
MSVLAIAGVAAGLAGAAVAQVTPGSQQGLGLTGADIPDILKIVKAEPYRAPAEPACDSIPQEILALDKVLGPDVDGEQAKSSKVHMAMNYARGMIPYRGYVRFLTRADSKDKALQRAVTAGIARRAFLRGLEAHMQCAPAADLKVADISDRVPVVEAGPVETVPLPASALKVAPPAAAKVEVADARPAFTPAPAGAPGNDLARQMLTPARAIPAAMPLTEPQPSAPRPSGHVVYRLIDTVSGRPIVPDEPSGDSSGR